MRFSLSMVASVRGRKTSYRWRSNISSGLECYPLSDQFESSNDSLTATEAAALEYRPHPRADLFTTTVTPSTSKWRIPMRNDG